MQTVSPSFAPYSDTRWADMRVVFRLVDTTAASNATATASGSNTVSQLTQTHDNIEGMSQKWATLENGGWFLDGTYQIMPDDVAGQHTGWWSDVLSGADSLFVSDPTLTFNFTADHDSIGFTVIFDDKANMYPAEFVISAYNSTNTLIDSQTVACTSARQVVDMPVTDYRKVVIQFTRTQLPYQHIRVAEVIFGIVQNFDRSNSTAGSVLYEVSPTANNLPSNELEITFDNTDRKYNMINPNGLYSYLQQSQPLDVEIGIGESKNALEYVNMGRFYFAKSRAEDSSTTAKITAYDRFYTLDKSICRIGTTGTWTVSAAVAAVISDSGLDVTTSIPAAIGNITINKCIPSEATHREALRLIAQAAMCTCYFNRDDELIFATLTEGTLVDTLDNNNLYDVAKISVTDRANTVELTVRDEYAETETLYTANNIAAGESVQTLSVDNPLVAAANGSTVAGWLLTMANKRLIYELAERGNPARELGDTVKIYDAYGENRNAIITKEDFTFDGTLKASTKAWGG
mgnify:CR=1 FL=1